uniref:Transmembrane protein n=1 Tax=Rhabditophanes sp. KR3021 TaxID=114890 RepID=A0AC35UFW0_9BILA
MKAFIFLAIALFTVSTAAQQYCDPAQYASVRQCYSQYFNTYNLTIGANATLPSYIAFAQSRGKDELGFNNLNMAKVCLIQNTLSNCIGQNSACINPTDFPKIFSVNNTDNYEYVEDFFVGIYECQTAYNITISNFYCLASVGKNGFNSIAQCETQLNTDIANQVPICTAENTFVTCLSNVYQSYCGNDAGAYICNVENVALTHVLPQCIPTLNNCPAYST